MKNISLYLFLALVLVACNNNSDDADAPTCSDGIRNGDETGIDCGGSCPVSTEITFDEQGAFGNNLLAGSSGQINVSPINFYSLSASLGSGCTVIEVLITSSSPCNGCWTYFPEDNSNWLVSDYNFENNSQTFRSLSQEMDLRMNFVPGTHQIEVFVNGSTNPEKTITITSEYEGVQVIDDNMEMPLDSWRDGNLLYVGNGTNILRYNLDQPTTEPEQIASGLTAVYSLTKSGNYLYFLELSDGTGPDTGTLSRIDVIQGSSVETILRDLANPGGIATDGNDLYFTDVVNGILYKVDLTASNPTPTNLNVSGLSGPTGLWLNGNDLIIAESFAEEVSKVDISDNNYPLTSIATAEQLSGVPEFIYLSGNELYLSGNASVVKIDIGSSAPTETKILDTTGFSVMGGITVYNSETYFIEIAATRLLKFEGN